MVKAVFNGTVVAESDATIVVEGNHYFPPDSVVREHFVDHDRTTVCSWKGTAHYYSVHANGERADATAWYYPEPFDKAAEIRDYVAFYPAVTVS